MAAKKAKKTKTKTKAKAAASKKKTKKKTAKKVAQKKVAVKKKTAKKVAAKKAATKKKTAKKTAKKVAAKKKTAKKVAAKKAASKKKVAKKISSKKAAPTKLAKKDEPKVEIKSKQVETPIVEEFVKKTTIETELREALVEEVLALSEDFDLKDIFSAIRDVKFFLNHTNEECLERGCDNLATTHGLCRLHYIKNWKSFNKKMSILQDGKLQTMIEELVTKFPSKNIESILSDLADEKEFHKVLKDLNIDSDFDEDMLDDDEDDIIEDTKSFSMTRTGLDDTEEI